MKSNVIQSQSNLNTDLEINTVHQKLSIYKNKNLMRKDTYGQRS